MAIAEIQPKGRTEERAVIRAAARGEREAQRWLVRRLTPIIHARVAATLEQSPISPTRELVEDLVQDVWTNLSARRFADLRRWDPDRGAALTTFVAVCAQRRTVDFLRSGRRSASAEVSTTPGDIEQRSGADSALERRVAARDLATRLVSALQHELSPRGNEALNALFIDELSLDEAARRLSTTTTALYSWRRNIRRLALQLVERWSTHEARDG